ncbi:MAG: NAD-dependent deacylase [Chloroflexota bacterium]|nr:NAD-dependent deacylase [Chloroflexota bacterium]
MTTRPSDQDIHKAAQLIKEAHHAVALTGAGSSTPSGIPDFRSAGSGLWTRFNPMEVASLTSFRRNPERFFEWLRPLVRQMFTAQPNPAHITMAQLEKRGYIQATITQNIDGLHQRAGARNVLEVHGGLNTLSCIGCYQQYQSDKYIAPYVKDGIIPRCPACGRILKPDAVLFEEQLPAKTWLEARKACDTCDLIIVAGSSLVVMPVAGLPTRAIKNGAAVLVINKTPTYVDKEAAVVLAGDVAEILPSIVSKIIND